MSDIRHLMEFRKGFENTGFSDTPSLNMAYKHLYAGDHDEAERRFREIWSPRIPKTPRPWPGWRSAWPKTAADS